MPALIAGNAVVVKHATQTLLVGERIVRAFHEAGVPKDVIVNLFLASSALAFAISIIGVLIFAGLTAYDTQNIKNTYVQMAYAGDREWLGKAAIMGALNLYLDFINMFILMLQLLGNRN